MVSLQMDTQKSDKVDMAPSSQQPRSSKTAKVVWLYCGAVTSALVILAILGGLYYQDVRSMCQTVMSDITESRTHALKSKDNSPDGDGEVEVTRDTEIYYMRGANDSQSGVIVADFKRNLVGVYLKEADRCFLAKNLNDKLPNPAQIEAMVDEGMDMYDEDEDDDVNLEQDPENHYQGRYQVPYELHAMCWDKQINWLKEVNKHTASRQKRYLYCWYRCYRIWGRRFCVRYCVNIGK